MWVRGIDELERDFSEFEVVGECEGGSASDVYGHHRAELPLYGRAVRAGEFLRWKDAAERRDAGRWSSDIQHVELERRDAQYNGGVPGKHDF
jgi:hypothetical protein